jgi:HSP20 family protein
MTLVKSKTSAGLLPKMINDFFDTDIFSRSLLPEFGNSGFGLKLKEPSVNITEDTSEFIVEMAAPGLEKKDFKVEVENHTLCVSAEKKEEKKEEEKNYWRREFSYNSFSRSFQLPENSLPDKIHAEYNNGVLKLTLPKKEVTVTRPTRNIQVQ